MTTMLQTETSVHTVSFEFNRMPHSTELKRLLRAIEFLYYALLFSGEKHYDGNAGIWRDWFTLGFGTGLQQDPSGAHQLDRIRINTFSNGKHLMFSVRGGNAATLGRWSELLSEIEKIRSNNNGVSFETLLGAEPVRIELVDPVTSAISSLSTEEIDRIDLAMCTALEALSYPIVTGCRVSASL